jgi:circadian clock protein KaiC
MKSALSEKCTTGVPGLDDILSGGIPRGNLYLLQGLPGTGKTTLAMQFLLEGARGGEKVMYVTFSETKSELELVADSHGWDLKGIEILELSALSKVIGASSQTTLFHPSEVELSKTITLLLNKITDAQAVRVVFDSVSELRLLAGSSLRYRRQMLAFKEFFTSRGTTVLFLDDLTTGDGDEHVQSIVHGVMLLEKFRAAYGVERRQFHIVKLRGVKYRGGTHDYVIERGGIVMFPRLVAADHKESFKPKTFSSGSKELDHILGGGFDSGTSNLIMGPAGSGKSTIALKFAMSAADRGERVAIFNFEESPFNLITRAESLGLDLKKHLNSGMISLRKIDPAELTPGQFAALIRGTVNDHIDMVVIDSLNGYMHAMPEQQFLMLQLHELLAYLGNSGVVTVMVLAQAGIMGNMQTPLDLTYLADTVIITRFFEAFGNLKKAVSVVKKRTGPHEDSLCELKIGRDGITVGNVLKDFKGIFSGIPSFTGDVSKILKDHP